VIVNHCLSDFFPDNLEDETEDDDLFETEFRQYKRTYYMTKMGVDVVSEYVFAKPFLFKVEKNEPCSSGSYL
jgi:hypothetical protein